MDVRTLLETNSPSGAIKSLLEGNRYYAVQFGYTWSFSKKEFEKLLQLGAKQGFVDLSGYKEIKTKPSKWETNVYNMLDWTKDDFKWELKMMKK